ncbi:hypothetical protein SVIOM74S_09175 [Streptomyces violarus]
MNDNVRPSCSIRSGSAKYGTGSEGSSAGSAAGTGYAATSSYSARSGSERCSAICRSICSSRCPRQARRLRMRGARPRGCRASRIAFSGGSSSVSQTPSISVMIPRLAATTSYSASTTSAGYGS